MKRIDRSCTKLKVAVIDQNVSKADSDIINHIACLREKKIGVDKL